MSADVSVCVYECRCVCMRAHVRFRQCVLEIGLDGAHEKAQVCVYVRMSVCVYEWMCV